MEFSQIILNSIIRGSQLGLLALGVTMIFAILKFANFAHGEFAVVGAYLAFLFSVTLKINFVIAGLLAMLFTGLIGVLSDQLIFKRIRGQEGLVLLIAAMGLSFTLRHIVSTIWGADPLSYENVLAKPYHILGALITSTQLFVFIVAAAAMISFHLLLHKTKLGKAMRALSDNTSLAQARGIHVEKIIKWVWFICASYAALGGILIAWETLLWPELGFQILLPVFCAAILGGIGNVYGAIVGAMILGFVENLGLFLDWSKIFGLFGIFDIQSAIQIPTGYKPAIAFVALVIVLIFRPTGVLKGQKGD
jgi:branched-subunit amino acid ABC-type transport system permease component